MTHWQDSTTKLNDDHSSPGPRKPLSASKRYITSQLPIRTCTNITYYDYHYNRYHYYDVDMSHLMSLLILVKTMRKSWGKCLIIWYQRWWLKSSWLSKRYLFSASFVSMINISTLPLLIVIDYYHYLNENNHSLLKSCSILHLLTTSHF